VHDAFPVLPFRSEVYGPDELYEGFDPDDPTSYELTIDFRAFRSTRLRPTREVGMLRALHDQSITDARDELLAGRQVVAVMGGHLLARSAPAYTEVAELARAVAATGILVVSGGGPGAMEATHLGALLAGRPLEALHAAIDHLSNVPEFPSSGRPLVGPGGVVDEEVVVELHAWQRPAFDVLAGIDPGERGQSLAVPTWFYGHEPPTPFASHIAKYFSNSLREDGLLAIASDGVIYAEGSAGTIQEIFQDAAQNVYRVVRDRFSPMAFLDTGGCWSGRLAVEPLLRALFGDDDYERHVRISADPAELLAFVTGPVPEAGRES
jgi:predicted Rossmann-fold nucleotide-binding protein